MIVVLGGAPSEGVDVAISSFLHVKNQGLIEPVGLWNQQRGERRRSLVLNRDGRGPAHTQTITLPQRLKGCQSSRSAENKTVKTYGEVNKIWKRTSEQVIMKRE